MDRCPLHSTTRANSCFRPVRLRRLPHAFSLPARPLEETIEFRAERLPLRSTFSCYGKQPVKIRSQDLESCRATGSYDRSSPRPDVAPQKCVAVGARGEGSRPEVQFWK